ncbi:AsnC family transcriptional regulator [Vibrio sp. MACH09]|uniref:Lrp/AsnC family transcriptional regulator n=1 Tax=Vibrio sp. MACH09 TaxID=3025122 RepID=UPI00278E24D3|nr:Lrp/AsnC family transcriptional regulator [Vibrio sp. MACH09]GLO61103.1 AsnC family transcriptional regulator [Vibrio sp. MACH09]
MTTNLDNFDREILSFLQKDNTTPLRVLSEHIHLSTASIQRRIKRLKESGIIEANTSTINPEKVGQITIIAEVYTIKSHAPDLEDVKKCFSGPEVQQCYYVTGEADFILILTVPNMAEYDTISTRLFNNPNVTWFRTMVVMDRVKTSLHTNVLAT